MLRSRRLVHVAGLPADERLVNLDLAESRRKLSVCIASRMRCSMNHADFCVTPSDRPSSWLLMPFLEFAMSQIGGEPLVEPELGSPRRSCRGLTEMSLVLQGLGRAGHRLRASLPIRHQIPIIAAHEVACE